MATKLRVKKFKDGHGITDGKKWFFYYYEDQAQAEEMLKFYDGCETGVIKVNISYPEPTRLIEQKGFVR